MAIHINLQALTASDFGTTPTETNDDKSYDSNVNFLVVPILLLIVILLFQCYFK